MNAISVYGLVGSTYTIGSSLAAFLSRKTKNAIPNKTAATMNKTIATTTIVGVPPPPSCLDSDEADRAFAGNAGKAGNGRTHCRGLH